MPVPNPLRVPLATRQTRFESLCRAVQGCRACPRMEGRTRVLSPANGRPGVDLMFIAEAPGRHGADRTAIPIYGDATGHNFEMILTGVGLRRDDVFVTNAVLCNPRDETGTNDAPTREELENCSHHLESTIRMVWPKMILTMGANALAALSMISPHGLTLRSAVGKPHPWLGFTLFPLYHPSPRAILHRSLTQQTADLKAALAFLRRDHALAP